MTDRNRRRSLAFAALLACALTACGEPASRAELATHAEAARQPAELQVGNVRIHASLVPAATLNTTVAQRYGVLPARDTQLLLVGIRRGPAHAEDSMPANRVTARIRDLRGVQQDVHLHEVRSDGFIDYAGTVQVTPPDTLALEISVERDGAQAPDILRFSRDVFPL